MLRNRQATIAANAAAIVLGLIREISPNSLGRISKGAMKDKRATTVTIVPPRMIPTIEIVFKITAFPHFRHALTRDGCTRGAF